MKKVTMYSGERIEVLNAVLRKMGVQAEKNEWGYIDMEIPEDGFITTFFKVMSGLLDDGFYVTVVSLMIDDEVYRNWRFRQVGPMTPAKHLTWLA